MEEVEEVGAEDEEQSLFLPTPSFIASAEEEYGVLGAGLCCLFLRYFLRYFSGALYYGWHRLGWRAKGSYNVPPAE